MNCQQLRRTQLGARCSSAIIAIAAAMLASSAIAADARGQRLGRRADRRYPRPSIRYGTLPNGMKYAILANATPKGTASVRLQFAFGSIGEAENERGLAHFIEHMAFNGTTHVPEGEMVKILERQGLAFGPDTNAQTGFIPPPTCSTFPRPMPSISTPPCSCCAKSPAK